MKIYNLKFEQTINSSIEEAWNFFSSPTNLSRITPPHMNFVITSPQEKEFKMYPGMLITYRVSPLNGIRMNWVTEIKHVKEKDYFIDEQRVGPYALWHHRHKFEETNAGILMTDDLHYALPFGGLGRIMNRILVEKEINKIFTYRNEKIIEIFGRS